MHHLERVPEDARVRLLEANASTDHERIEVARQLEIVNELRPTPYPVADHAQPDAVGTQGVKRRHDVRKDVPSGASSEGFLDLVEDGRRKAAMADSREDRRVESDDALPRVLLGRLEGVLDVPPGAGLGLVQQCALKVLLGDIDARFEQALAVDAGPRWVGADQGVADIEEDDVGKPATLVAHKRSLWSAAGSRWAG